jgi:hypothetical protein
MSIHSLVNLNKQQKLNAREPPGSIRQKEIIKSFLEKQDPLLVDKNVTSITRLVKVLVDLGARRTSIHTCTSALEAVEIAKTKNIGALYGGYEGYRRLPYLRFSDCLNYARQECGYKESQLEPNKLYAPAISGQKKDPWMLGHS